jgi:hypothetical protein
VLSRILEEVVEVAGYAAALELCRGFGGRTVRVSYPLAETHPLALTMGYKPALAFAERFNGEAVAIPAERTALMDLRNQRIVADYLGQDGQPGASVSALSVDYGLTRKRITEVLDEAGVARRSLEGLNTTGGS